MLFTTRLYALMLRWCMLLLLQLLQPLAGSLGVRCLLLTSAPLPKPCSWPGLGLLLLLRQQLLGFRAGEERLE